MKYCVKQRGGNMKKYILASMIALTLVTACVGQEWTVEDWKDHLFLLNPTLSQDTSTMMPGFENLKGLPTGTHFAYHVEMEGTSMGIETPMTMDIGITFSGKEVIDGIDCHAIDLSMTMELSMLGESIKMEMEGTEWVDEVSGAPVKATMNMETDMESIGVPFPMEFVIERVGEAEYHGHDCWILEMSQEMEMMGTDLGEVKIVQYMDKETMAVVRQVMTMGEEEIDSEYIEPPLSGELQWELGHKETISTGLGTHECQIIVLKEEGKEVGKMWVSKDFKTPLRYVFSVQDETMEMTMTMTLTAYEFG
jgi:hypothetical protein